MLNRVTIEGIVTKSYKYKNDLLLRVASYRDPEEPIKRDEEGRDDPDYVNIRLTNAVPQLVNYEVGQHLRIEGLLQSREYQETLDQFLTRTNIHKLPNRPSVEIVGGSGREITAERDLMEVLGDKVVVIFEKKILVREDGTTVQPNDPKPDLHIASKPAVHAQTQPQPKPVVPPVQPKPVEQKQQPKPVAQKPQQKPGDQKNQPKPVQHNNQPKPQAANNQPNKPAPVQGKEKK